MKIAVINGPNLNLLGRRETGVYGKTSLPDILADLREFATGSGFAQMAGLSDQDAAAVLPLEISDFQSNHEGELIDHIHRSDAGGIVINPGAFTHTSIALRDALLGTQIPFVEIHISNIKAREEFRHHSWLADIARGVVMGFGPAGYRFALAGLVRSIVDGK